MKVHLRPMPILHRPRHRQTLLLQLPVEVPTRTEVDLLLAAASTTHAVVVVVLKLQHLLKRKPLQAARDLRRIVRVICPITRMLLTIFITLFHPSLFICI